MYIYSKTDNFRIIPYTTCKRTLEAVMSAKIKYITAGAAAGIVNGLLGAGGGLLLVPLLKNWCKLDARVTFATSVAVILPLCAVSAAVYFVMGNPWPTGTWGYLAGGLIGGLLGGVLLKKTPKRFLGFAFAGIMLYSGVKLFFS